MSGVFYHYRGISAIRSGKRQLTKNINYTKFIKTKRENKDINI